MPHAFPRHRFWPKAVAALLLVAIADRLFYGYEPGGTLGLFALCWTAALALTVPATWRRPAARLALIAAALTAVVLIDDPSPLGWLLFWTALSSAALLARRGFDDAARHLARVLLHGLTGVLVPLRDAARLRRLPRPVPRWSLPQAIAALALPLVGGTVFLLLFASANPVIDAALGRLRLPWLDVGALWHAVFWAFLLVIVWPAFRPLPVVLRLTGGHAPAPVALPGVGIVSVTLSLILFNALFAVQNLLDIAFLWSGAPLPAGMTMTEYAHRGAYPLIVTALLAGAFVLIATRPGTAIAARPAIRRLIALWTAQNLVLVASSILRTLDYIAASMLTTLRIAALAWMLLVALGLILIAWRMLTGKPLAWLVNRNALAAGLLLWMAALVDLGAVAAAWNVTHAREAGGGGPPLDLCYLDSLGPSALVPLAMLEQRPLAPAFADRVATIRDRQLRYAIAGQTTPYGWTWRTARRIDRVHALLGDHPRTPPFATLRDCDGNLPAPAPPPATPLTKAPAR